MLKTHGLRDLDRLHTAPVPAGSFGDRRRWSGGGVHRSPERSITHQLILLG